MIRSYRYCNSVSMDGVTLCLWNLICIWLVFSHWLLCSMSWCSLWFFRIKNVLWDALTHLLAILAVSPAQRRRISQSLLGLSSIKFLCGIPLLRHQTAVQPESATLLLAMKWAWAWCPVVSLCAVMFCCVRSCFVAWKEFDGFWSHLFLSKHVLSRNGQRRLN